jgi:hypothetical protein
MGDDWSPPISGILDRIEHHHVSDPPNERILKVLGAWQEHQDPSFYHFTETYLDT